jgi:hypothetical protein
MKEEAASDLIEHPRCRSAKQDESTFFPGPRPLWSTKRRAMATNAIPNTSGLDPQPEQPGGN